MGCFSVTKDCNSYGPRNEEEQKEKKIQKRILTVVTHYI